jgi:hypothetical protein
VGDVKLDNPITGETLTWSTPGGGRGYQRVPSLISIWATAPFLHNNEVGIFTNDPSVAGRMRAFDDAVQKLLWPARRTHTVRRTREVDTEEGKYDGTSALNVYTSALPSSLQLFVGDSLIARSIRTVVGAGALVSDGRVALGPIPAGTPVNLLANINVDKNDPRFSIRQLLSLLDGVKRRLQQIQGRKLGPEETTTLLKELVPNLIQLSTCPDFIVDRGHNFGTNLPDADKQALIEFVKTF